MSDEMGDRMKEFERMEAGRRFLPMLPVCARIDGKGFSRFTKGLARPFDPRLTELMRATTGYLVDYTNAAIGYTQSDEISLVWYSDVYKSQIFFDGKIQKMTSVLASLATAWFNHELPAAIPEKAGELALFDCRVWQVPTLEEAANVLLWREFDAVKNSISMATREQYPHKALLNKNGSEMQEMLFQKGINWNDYPAFFKRGTYVQKKTVVRKFNPDELESLPEKHEARRNPDLTLERSELRFLDLPPFSKVTNRCEVIFQAADPIVGVG